MMRITSGGGFHPADILPIPDGHYRPSGVSGKINRAHKWQLPHDDAPNGALFRANRNFWGPGYMGCFPGDTSASAVSHSCLVPSSHDAVLLRAIEDPRNRASIRGCEMTASHQQSRSQGVLRTAGKGHEGPFRPSRSGGERTLAGAHSNDEDAPKHKVAALQPATRGKRREAGSQLRGRL